DRGSEWELRRCLVDRAADEKIGRLRRLLRLAERMYRGPDEKIIAPAFHRDCARLSCRNRGCAQMDSVGIAGERHVEPVVDQHARPVRPRPIDCGEREIYERARREIALANLDQLAARGGCRLDDAELTVDENPLPLLALSSLRLRFRS